MPTYSYRCPKCGHEYEKLQKMSDTTLIKCPECGVKGERLITAGAGIVFKGSGFYETDYKRAGERNNQHADEKPAKKESAESKKPESKEPTKTVRAKDGGKS